MPTYDETLRLMTTILEKHVDVTTLPHPIRATDHIQSDLGLDSLGVMEVVAEIEDRFHVHIPAETLAGISTVDDVAKALMTLEPPN